MKLRPYQQKGVNSVYQKIAEGSTRNIFWLQTGGGKTITFSTIVKDIMESGGHAVVVVKRRELIKQTSSVFDKLKILHGVHMARHSRYCPERRVQICSIDTLSARDIAPHADKDRVVVLVDEAHDVRPSGRKYMNLLRQYWGKPIIGFTATPFGNNSFWEDYVKPIEAHELMELGYLVPERTWIPNIIDTSNVSVRRTGDFNERELFEASSGNEIIGDFVRDWLRFAQDRPTILFAVNVEHSKLICKAYNEAGIPAVHADAKTSSRERDKILNDIKVGKVKVITNVDIFSTGLDLPMLSCVQLCRPTQSLIWHLQAIGRGLRTHQESGKENCIIIDNAGNTLRHGRAYDVREITIGEQRRESETERAVRIIRCEKCYLVYEPTHEQCPECGHKNKKQQRRINRRDGELVELEMTPQELKALRRSEFVKNYYQLSSVAKRRGMRPNWVTYKLKEKYGEEYNEFKPLLESR